MKSQKPVSRIRKDGNGAAVAKQALRKKTKAKSTLDDAIASYARWCERKGYVFDQPSSVASAVGRKFVHLRNSYRQLAKFDIKKRRIVEA